MLKSNFRNIVCCKYDDAIKLNNIKINKILYHPKSIKQNKKLSLKSLSTNGELIFDGKSKYPLNTFYDSLNKKKFDGLIVLTEKEKALILSWIVRHKLKIIVLETSYPIFSDIKYSKNIKNNYYKLNKCLKYL